MKSNRNNQERANKQRILTQNIRSTALLLLLLLFCCCCCWWCWWWWWWWWWFDFNPDTPCSPKLDFWAAAAATHPVRTPKIADRTFLVIIINRISPKFKDAAVFSCQLHIICTHTHNFRFFTRFSWVFHPRRRRGARKTRTPAKDAAAQTATWFSFNSFFYFLQPFQLATLFANLSRHFSLFSF